MRFWGVVENRCKYFGVCRKTQTANLHSYRFRPSIIAKEASAAFKETFEKLSAKVALSNSGTPKTPFIMSTFNNHLDDVCVGCMEGVYGIQCCSSINI